jgi:hypothetical protein
MQRRIDFMGTSWHDWPDGQKGVGSIKLRMILIGEHGAITWSISTGWMLPETLEAWQKHGIPPRHQNLGQGFPVVIHAPTPVEDYMEGSGGECDVLPSGYCYGDAGFLAGDEFFETLIREGEEAVWRKMEEWYLDHLVKFNTEGKE